MRPCAGNAAERGTPTAAEETKQQCPVSVRTLCARVREVEDDPAEEVACWQRCALCCVHAMLNSDAGCGASAKASLRLWPNAADQDVNAGMWHATCCSIQRRHSPISTMSGVPVMQQIAVAHVI
jgi:hypothetical protein